MPTRTATAIWDKGLKDGTGRIELGSNAFGASYSFAGRFGDGTGTNPEELLGAAYAGCFSMALAKAAGDAGYPPKHIDTAAEVHLDKSDDGFAIKRIKLTTTADIPGIKSDKFSQLASETKSRCPIGKALAVPQIELDARLVSP